MASVLEKDEKNFIKIGPITNWEWKKKPKVYETSHCDECGELTFVNKLINKGGLLLCPCCLQKLKEDFPDEV